jgi:hypothetical protein
MPFQVYNKVIEDVTKDERDKDQSEKLADKIEQREKSGPYCDFFVGTEQLL